MVTPTSDRRPEQLARNQIASRGINADAFDFVPGAGGRVSLCSNCDHVRGIVCRDCFTAQGGVWSFYADYVSSAAGYRSLDTPPPVQLRPGLTLLVALVAVLFSSIAMSTEISQAKNVALDFRAKATTFNKGFELLTHGRRCLEGVKLTEIVQEAQARIQDPDCAAFMNPTP
jgi:hypothetical protein